VAAEQCCQQRQDDATYLLRLGVCSLPECRCSYHGTKLQQQYSRVKVEPLAWSPLLLLRASTAHLLAAAVVDEARHLRYGVQQALQGVPDGVLVPLQLLRVRLSHSTTATVI
jgi:hypothetical protein